MPGDWGFLSKLMDNAEAHSSPIGQMWMAILFLFRLLVLFGDAEGTWSDEVSGFECDTREFFCKEYCYKHFFPISPMSFWTLQIILVSTPTLAYLAHVTCITRDENKLREQLANPQQANPTRRPRFTDERGRVKIKGKILCSYLLQLLAKIAIEAVSVWLQYKLFNLEVKWQYVCNAEYNVNHQCKTPTNCFMSRNEAKEGYFLYFVAIACFSVLLNILEMVYLLCKQKCCFRPCKQRNRSRVVVEDPEGVQVHGLPSNSHMLQNLQNQQLEDNDVVMEVEEGLTGSLSGSLDGHQGEETTRALVHHQGRRSSLFP